MGAVLNQGLTLLDLDRSPVATGYMGVYTIPRNLPRNIM